MCSAGHQLCLSSYRDCVSGCLRQTWSTKEIVDTFKSAARVPGGESLLLGR